MNPTEQYREAVRSALEEHFPEGMSNDYEFDYADALASIQASTAKVIKEWVGQYGSYAAGGRN